MKQKHGQNFISSFTFTYSYNINKANKKTRRKCSLIFFFNKKFCYLLLTHLLNQQFNVVLDFATIIRARRTKNFIFIVIVRPNSHHHTQVHRRKKIKYEYIFISISIVILKEKHPFYILIRE
jgi:hypothetical protein